MSRRSESRVLGGLLLVGVLLAAFYGVDALFTYYGRGSLLGGGLFTLAGRGCSALPVHLPVPCWLVVAGPLALFFLVLGMAGGRR